MVNQKYAGWCLVLAGFLLLGAYGRLDLLSVLLPMSLLLAIALPAGCGKKTKLSDGMKKG